MPLLVFNGLFTGRLPDGVVHDNGVPQHLLLAENALRAVVFVGPLWLPLSIDDHGPSILFALGSALYLSSWRPAIIDDGH